MFNLPSHRNCYTMCPSNSLDISHCNRLLLNIVRLHKFRTLDLWLSNKNSLDFKLLQLLILFNFHCFYINLASEIFCWFCFICSLLSLDLAITLDFLYMVSLSISRYLFNFNVLLDSLIR